MTLPDRLWQRHAHILARSGGGKTQLLQTLFMSLIQQDASFFIVDSQNQMLPLIERKYKNRLGDRLIHVQPRGYLPALNLFDFGEADPDDEEQWENRYDEAVQTLNALFSLSSLELTGLQSGIFDLAVKVMLAFPQEFGRPATLEDLTRLFTDGTPYLPVFARLSDDDASSCQAEFLPRNPRSNSRQLYLGAKDEIFRRLRALLTKSAFRRMMSAERTDFDLFGALERGSVVLVNTHKQALKADSSLFGRFFIEQFKRVMNARLDERKHRRVYFILDEAQEYFTTNLSEFLLQARKCNIACIFANQQDADIAPHLHAIKGAAIRFATNIHPDEVKTVASSMRVPFEFLERQQPEPVRDDRDPRWADFALAAAGRPPASIRLHFGALEKFEPPWGEYIARFEKKPKAPRSTPPPKPPAPVEEEAAASEPEPAPRPPAPEPVEEDDADAWRP